MPEIKLYVLLSHFLSKIWASKAPCKAEVFQRSFPRFREGGAKVAFRLKTAKVGSKFFNKVIHLPLLWTKRPLAPIVGLPATLGEAQVGPSGQKQVPYANTPK